MLPKNIRNNFPLISNRAGKKKPFVYFDSAATSQKPTQVILAEKSWYEELNANVHRGVYDLSEQATAAFENVRDLVRDFISAEQRRSIVFTKSATEGINIVAQAWARHNLKKGVTILLTEMEHHANLVPWQALARERGLKLRFWPVDSQGKLVMTGVKELLSGVKLLSLTHVSNILGTVNPVKKIIQMARAQDIAVLVDACQSVPHMPINMKSLKADFLVFSAHKMLGPTGVGVLYIVKQRWEEMEPFLYGGDMILEVGWTEASYKSVPWKLEAGTQALAQVHALGECVKYLQKLDMENVWTHQQELTAYAYGRLKAIPEVTVYGPGPAHRGALVSFNVRGIHAHDLATLLNEHGICIRAGHHCAQPLHRKLGIDASARVSFHIYNTRKEIDYFVGSLKKIILEWQRLTTNSLS